ncbi:MAG TPA: NADH-quinone oxidoreductase subunit H [Elusimicrobiota bacterium]|nr:NADH-quinone oxidoreductase subunit H [Elusimicrobiota bacterium]
MADGSMTNVFLAAVLSPLLLGVINRTKAFFAGRKGVPLGQAYYDAAKLLRKGMVLSRTTTPVFWLGPVAGLAAMTSALLFVPLGGLPAAVSFPGDWILLAGLLALARFLTVLSALDTGSSFEGMGASREAFFASLTEPVFLSALAALSLKGGASSLNDLCAFASTLFAENLPAAVLVAAALFIVYLTENARLPVDDPNTHLELTMIHEVMVLDHSGPLFGYVVYGTAVKLWIFGSIVVSVCPLFRAASAPFGVLVALAGLLAVAVLTGVVESVMARLRLLRVPLLIAGAGVSAVVGAILLTGVGR